MSSHINELGQRQIVAATKKALQRADALGVVPTPLDDLSEEIGVETIDISQLPEELEVNKPAALKKLLGAFWFPAETVFVDFNQSKGRTRFIQAHEIGHRVVPWHKGAYLLDDEQRLFRDTEDLLELEANLAGAHLLFQGQVFFDRALEYQNSLKTPVLLADSFDTSLHATIRYYVEHHPEPLAVLITGRHKRANETVPIFHALESHSFRERLGAISRRFSSQSIPLNDAHPLGPLLVEAHGATEPPTKEVKIPDLDNQHQSFVAEAFFNQHCYFVMFAPTSWLRSGRRIKVAS